MRRVWMGLAVSLLTVLVVLGAQAMEQETLTGEYQWSQGGSSGELRAEFTGTGENTWDVAFHFKFRGKRHVYRGTAEGSLTAGALSGEVQNRSRRRTFSFTGTTTDGVFEGTHAELEDGKPYATGTLSLRAGS